MDVLEFAVDFINNRCTVVTRFFNLNFVRI